MGQNHPKFFLPHFTKLSHILANYTKGQVAKLIRTILKISLELTYRIWITRRWSGPWVSYLPNTKISCAIWLKYNGVSFNPFLIQTPYYLTIIIVKEIHNNILKDLEHGFPIWTTRIQHTFGNGNRLESPIPCLLSAGSLGLDRMTNFFSLMAGCTLLYMY